MGQALAFKYIFDEIESDKKQQYYPDIAFQYGKLLRLIFNFYATDSAALVASIPGVEPAQAQAFLEQFRFYVNGAADHVVKVRLP
jgi:hypothetical protein